MTRGTIVVSDASGSVVYELPIAGTGPGLFSGIVYAGTYDVTLHTANDDGLQGLPADAYKRLATAVAITGDATPAYDLSLATISGTMTVGGAVLPNLDTARGYVVLTDAAGHSQSIPVSSTGPAVFSGKVFKGTYDVGYRAPTFAVRGLPMGGAPVVSGLAVTADRMLTFDLPVASVSGAVTLAGAALPDSPAVSTGATSSSATG